MLGLVSLGGWRRCGLDEWCLRGVVWVGVRGLGGGAAVCRVGRPGLALFEILEGAPLFLCDILFRWLGLLDTGSGGSPEVLDSLCIGCSGF